MRENMHFATQLVYLSGIWGETNVTQKTRGTGEQRYSVANGINLNVCPFSEVSIHTVFLRKSL
jgi:hypothetical protein